MPPIPRQLAALLLSLLLSSILPADILTGKVVKVVDGDTVYILDADKSQHFCSGNNRAKPRRSAYCTQPVSSS